MSTFGNPFRSTAEMVGDGTVGRPAYLDVDRLSAAVRAADQKKRLRSADRAGRRRH